MRCLLKPEETSSPSQETGFSAAAEVTLPCLFKAHISPVPIVAGTPTASCLDATALRDYVRGQPTALTQKRREERNHLSETVVS